MNCPNNKSRNCCNSCGTYVTIQGPPGPMGPEGDTGETPAITVVEDTPLSYKLNFKTSTEDITTPNLFKSLDEYHVDLSASGSTMNIPLESLILTYQNTSSSSVRISVAARTSIWVQWSEVNVSYEAPST